MNNKTERNIILSIFYIAVSVLFILPYIKWQQLNEGWDMIFHLRRINELAMTLKEGKFLSYISTYVFKSFGYPVGIFYPNLTLLPFAVFKNLMGVVRFNSSWYGYL